MKIMVNGPITDEQGDTFWYKNNHLHREDGPAMEFLNGARAWVINGKFHKISGPAIIYSSGAEKWYINGIKYEPEKHPFNIFRSEYNLSDDYEEWTSDMKMLFKLTYG